MHPEIARQLHEQRLRDQQRRRPVIDRMAAGTGRPAPRRGHAVRRAIGRTLVRIGTAIEAEPRQPVASR
jgi:hypothetical protein